MNSVGTAEGNLVWIYWIFRYLYNVVLNCSWSTVILVLYLTHFLSTIILSDFEIREFKLNLTKLLLFSAKGEILFNSGNSFLFSCKPEVLADALKTYTLDITLLSKTKLPLGSVRIPWDKDFTNVVQFIAIGDEESFEAAMFQDCYTLQDTKESPVCQIELLARLTCFGKCIRTHFQIQRDGMSKKFLFRTGQANTVFQCQK